MDEEKFPVALPDISKGETDITRSPIDVDGNRGEIVEIVQNMIQAQQEGSKRNREEEDSNIDYDDLAVTAICKESLIPRFWGTHLRQEANGRPRYKFTGVKGFSGQDFQIEGEEIFRNSADITLDRSVILGESAFYGVKNARIDHSLVYGLSPSPFTGFGAFIAATTPTQVEALFNAYRALQREDEPHAVEAIEAFDREITPETRASVDYAEDNPAFHSYGRKYAVATHLMQSIAAGIPDATINVDVANSIVYGMSPFTNVVGGKIKDSVIGGSRPFGNANLHLINTTVVTWGGVKHYDDEYIGNSVLARIGEYPTESPNLLSLPRANQ